MIESTHKVLYTQQDLPIFQNKVYPDKESALACARGDIRLIQNQRTGLIYNQAFQQELMVYDSLYQNEQAHSSFFTNHLQQVAAIIKDELGSTDLVEIGCGKGFFLEMLNGDGIQVDGYDPAYEGNNARIKKRYFDADISQPYQGIILRHVLEHVEDPYAFLEKIRIANGNQGRIYIEVPCFSWICDHQAWFDIFYEHVNYFRISDLENLFGQLHQKGALFGGQYLYVVAELASLRQPEISRVSSINLPGQSLNPDLSTYSPGVVWGASSKGVIFCLKMLQAGKSIDFSIDINPVKQGKFMPATGVEILSPEEAFKKMKPGTTIYIMNSNYSDEIISRAGSQFKYVEIDRV